MILSNITRREMLALGGSLGLASLAALALEPKLTFPQPKLSPYAARVLSLKPVGYWRLGEAKGPTASDWTGHKHNGTYHGDPLFHQPGAIRPDANHSIGLDGKSYIEVENSPDFSLTSHKHGMTVEAWLRVPERLVFPGETRDPYVHWLGKGEKGNFEWGFRFYSKNSSRPNRISAYIWNPKAPPGEPNEGARAY